MLERDLPARSGLLFMSALGHKRTLTSSRTMSALPQKRTLIEPVTMSAMCQKRTKACSHKSARSS